MPAGLPTCEPELMIQLVCGLCAAPRRCECMHEVLRERAACCSHMEATGWSRMHEAHELLPYGDRVSRTERARSEQDCCLMITTILTRVPLAAVVFVITSHSISRDRRGQTINESVSGETASAAVSSASAGPLLLKGHSKGMRGRCSGHVIPPNPDKSCQHQLQRAAEVALHRTRPSCSAAPLPSQPKFVVSSVHYFSPINSHFSGEVSASPCGPEPSDARTGIL